MGMYESPIKIIESTIDSIYKDIAKKRDDAIFAEIQSSFGVDLDRGELIRALQYDRDQYNKGYADGKRDAMEELVRCKDCTYCEKAFDDYWCNFHWNYVLPIKPKQTREDGFCHNAERRERENETE